MRGPNFGARATGGVVVLYRARDIVIFSLLFLGLIVVGTVFVVRSLSDGGRTTHRHGGSRALDILDERFARGEINQSEYEERRRILAGDQH
jgi:putative membrane protein